MMAFSGGNKKHQQTYREKKEKRDAAETEAKQKREEEEKKKREEEEQEAKKKREEEEKEAKKKREEEEHYLLQLEKKRQASRNDEFDYQTRVNERQFSVYKQQLEFYVEYSKQAGMMLPPRFFSRIRPPNPSTNTSSLNTCSTMRPPYPSTSNPPVLICSPVKIWKDKAYVACRKIISPIKYLRTRKLIEEEVKFNKILQLLRSPVERCFSRLHSFRVVKYCPYREEICDLLIYLVCLVDSMTPQQPSRWLQKRSQSGQPDDHTVAEEVVKVTPKERVRF
eukprot:PhF_6_TR33722/c1_g3_i4/m.49515